MKNKLVPLIAAALLSVAAINANATIIAVGDSNITTTNAAFDNATWFNNILGTGTDVLVRTGGVNSFQFATMFNFIGATTATTTATITAAALAGVDVFVSSTQHLYSAAELAVILAFEQGGGTVFTNGEHSSFPGENAAVNHLLAGIGSTMLVPAQSLCGLNTLTGAQIASHPLNAGVNNFQMGCTSRITGGTALLFTDPGFAMAACENCGEQVPEPGTLALLGIGLAALGLRRRRTSA